MTNSEINVTSSSSGYESLVIRASVGEAGASALAACRASLESSALLGFGHAATLRRWVALFQFALRFRGRQHSDAPRLQFGSRFAWRAVSFPLPSHLLLRCRQPSSAACRSPQHGARLLLLRPVLQPRTNAVASPTERLTMRCSERLRASRHLLPPPPFHPPCRCRAALRRR